MSRRWTAAVGIGILALGAVSGIAAAAAQPLGQAEDQTAISPAVEAGYEAELVAFLETNPRPESGDFDHTVNGRNSYWQSLASWWEQVPWDAVAGQWGCTSGGVEVNFNPADSEGVSSAGYGGMIDCGTRYDSGTVPMLTEPTPRSEVDIAGQ